MLLGGTGRDEIPLQFALGFSKKKEKEKSARQRKIEKYLNIKTKKEK